MARRIRGRGAAFLTVFWSCLSLAQDPAIREVPERTGSGQGDTIASLATLGIGLLVVVALIFGCAWLVRRMNGLTGMNSGAMKVVSVMALGARERIALIDVAGTQILVGITPGAIRTLHVFDEPVVTPGQAVSGDFARKLQGLMARHWKPEPAGGDSGGGEPDAGESRYGESHHKEPGRETSDRQKADRKGDAD